MPLSSKPSPHRHRTTFGAILGAILVIGSFSIAAATPPGTVIDYEQTASAELPQSSFVGSAGGDGWALAFTDTKVYNIWHRVLLTIACRSKATGAACSGNGYSGTGTKVVSQTESDVTYRFQTAMGPSMYIDEATNRLFATAVRGRVGSVAGTSGVVEIDLASTSSNPFVAFYPLSRDGEGACYDNNCGVAGTVYATLSNATKVGNKWYVYNYVEGVANPALPDSRNKLLCFDFATKSACGGQPYDVTTSTNPQRGNWEPPSIAAIGNRIFINIYDSADTNSLAQISCVDVSSTPTNCTGWPIVPSTKFVDTFTAAPAFPLLNSAGTPIGVCFPGSTANACTDFAGVTITDTAVVTTALAGLANPFDANWGTTRGEVYVDGTRIFMPNVVDSAGNSDVECYDFATNSLCAGFSKTFTLSELQAVYTIQTDPADPRCLWVNSHGGTGPIQNFNSQTGGACVPDGFVLSISNFRESPSRCAATAWKQFTLVSPAVGNFTSGTVEFADAAGTAIGGIGLQSFGADGILDLTSLNLHTYPSLSRLHVRLVGTTTTAISVKMKWSAEWHTECDDGGQTTFTTTTTTSTTTTTTVAPVTTTSTTVAPVTTTTTTTTTTVPSPTTVTTCARRGAPTSRQVIFSGDSAELLRPARTTMRSIIAQLRVACAVTITGHAADDGDPNGDVAQNLSARRARVVAAFLRKRGVNVTAVNSYGKTQPTSRERASNRRVEITWHLPR